MAGTDTTGGRTEYLHCWLFRFRRKCSRPSLALLLPYIAAGKKKRAACGVVAVACLCPAFFPTGNKRSSSAGARNSLFSKIRLLWRGGHYFWKQHSHSLLVKNLRHPQSTHKEPDPRHPTNVALGAERSIVYDDFATIVVGDQLGGLGWRWILVGTCSFGRWKTKKVFGQLSWDRK